MTLALLAGISPAAAAPTYSVVQLGVLAEGGSVVVRAINDAEQIAGSAIIAQGHRAFLLTRSALQRLDAEGATDYSVALGINGRGEVVGARNGPTAVRAFRWAAGQGVRELAPLPGDTGSQAFGINAAGRAVGYSSGPTGIRAVVWDPSGAPQPLPGPAATSESRALWINDADTTVGVSGARAVRWANGAARDLGALPGHDRSEALHVNTSGEAVGSSGPPAASHAVRWSAGDAIEDLGVLTGGDSSRALWINDTGSIVGTSDSLLGSRAVLWTRTEGPLDLNTLAGPIAGLVLTQAMAINNRGVIVALGRDETGDALSHGHDAHEHAVRVVLLIPNP